jgi:hypothetical protein
MLDVSGLGFSCRGRRAAGDRVTVIGLSSSYGTATFEAPAVGIARFLQATFRLVPDRAEPPRADIDAGIAATFAEGGAG